MAKPGPDLMRGHSLPDMRKRLRALALLGSAVLFGCGAQVDDVLGVWQCDASSGGDGFTTIDFREDHTASVRSGTYTDSDTWTYADGSGLTFSDGSFTLAGFNRDTINIRFKGGVLRECSKLDR